jgi:hypothetical protein
VPGIEQLVLLRCAQQYIAGLCNVTSFSSIAEVLGNQCHAGHYQRVRSDLDCVMQLLLAHLLSQTPYAVAA